MANTVGLRGSLALAACSTALCLSSSALAAPAAPSLCAPQEKVIFSCGVGRKIVSICASPSFPGPASSLQYRYGLKGAPEQMLPKDGASRQGVTSGSIAYSRGGGAYLAFVNGKVRYVIYSVIMNSGADEAQGLVAMQGDKVLSKQTCHKSGLTDTLQPDLPTVPPDTQGFDVP